jgi:hypothetical protein
VEERRVRRVIGRLRGGRARDRTTAEEHAEQRAHAVDRVGDVAERIREAVAQAPGELLQPRVGGLGIQELQRRQPRGHRHRVPRQRPGLVDVPLGREALHDVSPAAERRQRESATEDLAERGEIGRDAEPLLRAAGPEPEAGDDLVEDQQRAVLVAQATDLGQVAGRELDHPGVGRDRLDDHGGHVR